MSHGFVYLRPLLVAFVRCQGPYHVSSNEAWSKVFAWLDAADARRDVSCGYGLLRDDPNVVAREKCRYDACVELKPEFESKLSPEFSIQSIPGGAYFRARHVGQGQDGTISMLRDTLIPSKGFKVDPRRPFVEVYFDDPAKVPSDKRRVDVCIPVSFAAATGEQRMAS